VIQQGFKDGWGQDWLPRKKFIQGVWYETLQLGNRSYILLKNSTLAFVFFHLIVASKFKMLPNAHNAKGFNVRYDLTYDVINIIHQDLETHRLADLDQD
jgi:hypothetical protein